MPKGSAEKLFDQLAKGKPVPAVVLQGTDSYLLEMCRKKIVDAFVPDGARDWAVAKMSARESGWDEIVARAQMLPMLAPRQVVFVQDAASVERLGEKSREEVIKILGEYLSSPAPHTVLVLEAASLDARQKFAKLLAEEALIVELTIDPASAVLLAQEMTTEAGVKIDRDALALLSELVNGQPARLRVEIEKLAAYANGAGSITVSDVEALVVSERKNTVWQMADMLAGGRRGEALAFLDNLLREGEQPQMIVGALATSYRRLVEARELPVTMNKFQAAQRLHTWPDVAEAALRNAHRMPKKRLLAGLVALADADSRLKSSNPDPRALLEFLIVRI